ncbi:dCTP deaminase/dUTPase family protein [Blattabacterium cuenoti]|uniref:dUTP diphosphatase n=1 Tax=Blattabacterium cuenoti TaxID=1653831 RepID=UPI001EEC30B8|nr:dUTP diphosphatase [Blattabacterium cuenoti]
MHKQYRYTEIFSKIKKTISISFLERKLISTGFFIEFNKEMKYHIFFKKKLIKGLLIIHIEKKEIKIIVINIFFNTTIIIKPYEKLALLNIVKVIKIKWEKSTCLNKSIRGNNNFGSTGI